MKELRWNPLLRTYTIVAANRQNRPNLPKGWCPFCPSSGQVPENFTVHKHDNDFPCMSQDPMGTMAVSDPFFKAMQSYGKCEVILYSPEHDITFPELSVAHIEELVRLWKERFEELRQDDNIKYIFPFENRGEAVGVTIHHPHGQLYAYPFVPLKLKTELDSCKDFHTEHGHCLFCEMNTAEQKAKVRIITENDSFVSYLPYFTDYPFGAFIVSKQHLGNFAEFEEKHIHDLAVILKNLTGAFDCIYDKPFPYMMCIHQTPVNTVEYADSDTYFHFHIEFYPPLRSETAIKYYASSEMGAWAAANTMAVEESVQIIRKALEKFMN